MGPRTFARLGGGLAGVHGPPSLAFPSGLFRLWVMNLRVKRPLGPELDRFQVQGPLGPSTCPLPV